VDLLFGVYNSTPVLQIILIWFAWLSFIVWVVHISFEAGIKGIKCVLLNFM
jgi:hypothetical protein